MDNWKEVEDNYAFLYLNPEKGSKKVLVKCLVMNKTLLVDVLKEGGSPLHLELNASEYVQVDSETNYGSQFKNLRKLVELLLQFLMLPVDIRLEKMEQRLHEEKEERQQLHEQL